MKELFPMKQVNGFIASLLLTLIALSVVFLDMSFGVAITVLLVTAFAQAGLQFIVFMHAGETSDSGLIFGNLAFGIIMVLIFVFGSLLALVWGYIIP